MKHLAAIVVLSFLVAIGMAGIVSEDPRVYVSVLAALACIIWVASYCVILHIADQRDMTEWCFQDTRNTALALKEQVRKLEVDYMFECCENAQLEAALEEAKAGLARN